MRRAVYQFWFIGCTIPVSETSSSTQALTIPLQNILPTAITLAR
jgi:hypothetical protein